MKTLNFRILQEEISFWFEGVLASLPYSRIGNTLRALYWSRKLEVTKDVPPLSIAVGVPARIIKQRKLQE